MRSVSVHLLHQSQPCVHEGVANTYTKDGLFCVMGETKQKVWKYPVLHIFRVVEEET